MRVAITGSSGLAKTIIDTLEATPADGKVIQVFSNRIEDIITNGKNWWGWEYDVLINFAHDDFEQTKILELAHNKWKDDESKYIINFSSRAAQPNISKGYLYAAAKASLNHLANNYQYNSDKKYIGADLFSNLLPAFGYQKDQHKKK